MYCWYDRDDDSSCMGWLLCLLCGGEKEGRGGRREEGQGVGEVLLFDRCQERKLGELMGEGKDCGQVQRAMRLVTRGFDAERRNWVWEVLLLLSIVLGWILEQ